MTERRDSSGRAAALVDAIYEEPLAPEEFRRRLALALAEKEELEAARELVAWFKRRYPTVKERFDYVRRRRAEWLRSAPKG